MGRRDWTWRAGGHSSDPETSDGTLQLAYHLDRPFDRDTEMILAGEAGRANMVWFIDYSDRNTRRVRDLLVRTAGRFGADGVALSIRFLCGDTGEGGGIAARAAIAAWKQGRLPEMHRALFSRPPVYTEAIVLGIAKALEYDIERFRADMNSDETLERIAADEASIAGASPGAPVLFINGRHYLDAWDETALIEAVERPLGQRVRIASTDFFEWAASAGLVLILATLAALFIANIGFHDAYEHFRETPIGLTVGGNGFSLPLEAWINDGLMALFFLLVGIEIKRELLVGELSDPSRAALPIIGAIGGMVAPALIYAGINWGHPDTVHGWGVPMATDIAFTLGIMALLGDRVPTSLKVFVSALAIADDLGAILVIALFYGEGFHMEPFLIACGVMVLMIGLNVGRFYARTPYVLLGIVLWYFVHEAGLHATLAGVLTAAAIPSRRSGSVEGVAAQTQAIFEAEMREDRGNIADAAVMRLQNAIERLREPGFHLQHRLENWSNYLILPLFAFFNTGILVMGSSFSAMAPESMGVILGLLVGKPLGIVGICWIAVKLRVARLSSEISWTQMAGAGFLAGVGFTMAIFIASSAFSGAELESVKLAVLMASSLAAVTGAAILWHAGAKSSENLGAVPEGA
ncbi:Na+/H+ antiporter NhaA [Rhodobacterales bacterium HKCCE2091]|nr:Na+/H+ antiporter NhaA [Rhodobacterales bacterium HKCCE2091]